MTGDHPIKPARYEKGRPMLLGGLRRQHPISASGIGIPEQWRQFQSMGCINGQLGTKAYRVMCGATADAFEYMCAVEVGSFAGLPEHLGRMRIHAQDYAVFEHRENVSSIRATWESFDPLTGLGGVEIWISLSEWKLNTVAS